MRPVGTRLARACASELEQARAADPASNLSVDDCVMGEIKKDGFIDRLYL